MYKQKYGRPHRTWRGYKPAKSSGRCSKCTSLLSRVRNLPVELRDKIGGIYRSSVRYRASRPRFRMNLKKKVGKYFKKR